VPLDFFARCVRGLEWVVAAEATSLFGATVTRVRHREVAFALPGPTAAPRLRTADDLFATAGTVAGVGRHRATLAVLADGVGALDVHGARATAAAVRGLEPRTGDSFEVVASFLGRRNYNRTDVEDAVGAAIGKATGWSYQSRRDDRRPVVAWTVRVHIDADEAVLGVRCSDRPLHRRAYKQDDRPGTLHPPVAAAMSCLAGARPGGRLLDPFCGAGTIMVEAAAGATDLVAVGLDFDAEAVAQARANAGRAGVEVALVVGDAARLPFRPGWADVVVTNPPWGRAVAPAGRLRGASDHTRVLAQLGPDGRAVLLVDDPASDVTAQAVLVIPLSLFGRHPVIAVIDNRGEPFRTDDPLADALTAAYAAHGERRM